MGVNSISFAIGAFVVGSALSSVAYAQQGQAQSLALETQLCPFSNPIFRDLRTSAEALASKIVLPPKCNDIQKSLNEQGELFKKSIAEFQQMQNSDDYEIILDDNGRPKLVKKKKEPVKDDPNTPESETLKAEELRIAEEKDRKERENRLNAAVNGITTLSSLMFQYSGDKRCGKEVRSLTDVAQAMVDGSNQLAPYLGVFGSASNMSTSLGISVVTGAIKSFEALFANKEINMKDPKNQSLFIENACGFYALHTKLMAIMNSQAGEIIIFDKRMRELKKEIDALINDRENWSAENYKSTPSLFESAALAAPPSKVRDYSIEYHFLGRQRETLKGISTLATKYIDTPMLYCGIVGDQVRKSQNDKTCFPSTAVVQLDGLINERANILPSGDNMSAKRRLILDFYLKYVNNPQLFPENPTPEQAQACMKPSTDWLKRTGEVLTLVEEQLRELEELHSSKVVPFPGDHALISKLQLLEQFDKQRAFLKSLTERSESMEMRRLLAIREDIADSLFASEKVNEGVFARVFGARIWARSPALLWLTEVISDSQKSMRDYVGAAAQFNRYTESTTKKEFDTQQKKNFCSLAGSTLVSWNTADRNAKAANLFCDTFSMVINERDYPAVASYCVSFEGDGKVLKQLKQVREKVPEARKIYDWMKTVNCELPMPLTGVVN